MTNWETCVQFHGHACGGLTIGYKAACYAAELLELSFSGDEQVVCIAENDACGVDAIQALLGCSIGKGKYGTVYVGTIFNKPEHIALKRISKASMTATDVKNVMVRSFHLPHR